MKEFPLPKFYGEPTADGDIAADFIRQWYEANRETWFDRHMPFGTNRKHGCDTADNFILELISQVNRLKNAI
jgi:hypothetical protein